MIRSWCSDAIHGRLLTDAELLVSELVTNALMHGEGPIILRAWLDEDHLAMQVIDTALGVQAHTVTHRQMRTGTRQRPCPAARAQTRR